MKTIRSITKTIMAMTIGYAGIPDDIASAATITWTNAASGNWSMANNWSPNQVPGSGDSVLITNVGSYTVTLDVNATVSRLTLGGASGTQSLVQNGNTLTLNNSSSFGVNGSYNFGGGTINGSGNVAVNGVLNWSGGAFAGGSMTIGNGGILNWSGGDLGGPLTVGVNGVANLSGSYKTLYNVLTNYGVVTWTGGGLRCAYNGTTWFGSIYNQAGGLWDCQCDAAFDYYYNTQERFSNAGEFRKTSGTGTTAVNLAFNNSGEVKALQGTINFNNGGMLAGTQSAGLGTAINLNGGVFNYTNPPEPVFNGLGTNRFTGGTLTLLDNTLPNLGLNGGTLILGTNFQGGVITNLVTVGGLSGNYVVGGTLSVNAGVAGSLQLLNGAVLNWSGGTISSGLDITNGAVVNWSGGALGGSSLVRGGGILNWSGGDLGGPLTVGANGVANLSGSYKTLYNVLTNYGVVTWTGGGLRCAYNGTTWFGSIYNQAGGLWDCQCDAAFDYYYNTQERFSNAGEFRKTSGTGTTAVNLAFNNSGEVKALQGTINFNNGGMLAGTQSAGLGTAINLNGGVFNYTNPPEPVFNGLGTNRFTGGTLTLLDNTLPNLGLNGGTLILGTNFQGGVITNLVTVGGLSGNYVVGGTLSVNAGVAGSLQLLNGAVLNWSGGTISSGLDITNGAVVNWSGGALGGSSLVRGGGILNWSGGDLGGPLTVGVNGVANLSGSYKTLFNVLTNYGVVTWTGGGLRCAYNGTTWFGSIYNQAGGLWDCQCDAAFDYYYNTQERFSNAGEFRKTSGTGTTAVNLVFNNSGEVKALQGTINFNNGGMLAGTQSAGLGTAINLNGGVFNYTNPPEPVFNGLGTNRFTGGTLTLLDNTLPNLGLNGGTLILGTNFQGDVITNLVTVGGLSGNYVVGGTLSVNAGVAGSLQLLNGAVLNWSGGTISSGLDITNGAVVNWSGGALGGSSLVRGGGILNWSGGDLGGPLTVGVNGVANLSGSYKTLYNVLTNYGAVTWTGGGLRCAYNGTTWFGSIYNQAGGLWDCQCDAAFDYYYNTQERFSNAGEFRKTSGTGTTAVNLAFNNSGAVNALQGTINFNNSSGYVQSGATMLFGVTATNKTGHATMNGNVNFDGTLGITLLGGYTPQNGDTLSLINYGSRAGVFGALTLPALSPGLAWQTIYNPTALQLKVVTNGIFDAQISGSVKNGANQGVANATVFAYTTNSAGSFYLSTTTDPGGNYSLSVSNGIWLVGLKDLLTQGYNPVTNQTVAINNANQAVNFVLAPFTGVLDRITTTVNPAGSGTSSGDGVYPDGSFVVVTATVNASVLPYYFAGWTENSVLQSTNSTYVFTVQKDRHLVANFTLPTLTITASNNPPAAGSVAGGGTYFYASTNVLTAQPNFGYAFSNWTENGTVLGTSPTLSTVIYTNHVIVANYAEVNLSHVVTTATQPAGITAVSGAGIYTNGQTAVFSAPPVVTISPYLYKFQNFTVSNVVVSTSASFNKTFTTTDQTNLHYIANYSSLNIVPQVTNTVANYPEPVPATTNLVLTFQFDRTMNTNVTPSVFLTNAAALLQVTASGTGRWTSKAGLNDTYLTPPLTLALGMDGLNQVFISAASGTNNDILGLTNTLILTVDATPPVLIAVMANPGVTSCGISWSSDEAASSQVEFGLTTAYGSQTPLYGQLVKAHGLTLAELNPNTFYHFRVHSRDLAGNETISGDSTFTTLAAPDLQVQNLVVTGTFISGGNLVISWDDANTGTGATDTSWYDQVQVTNLSTGQSLLNSAQRYDAGTFGNIPGGGAQSRQMNFRLPDGPSGAGTLVITVTANSYNSQYEIALNNNTASVQKSSTLAGYPDLQVANLAVTNATLQSGDAMRVIWQDINSSSVPITGSFQDQVMVVNLDTAQTLANTIVGYDVTTSGAISAGLSVGRQFSFALPNGSGGAGNLQITVTTDSGNNIFEYNLAGTAESNNSNSIAAVSTLAAYPDLAVTNIVVPAGAGAGQVIQVVWTDINLGNAPATNIWSDQVFLSDVNVVGGGQLLGTFGITSYLAVGASLVQTQNVTLPPFVAGNQWIIVKANAGNSFFEMNPTNNSLVSTQAVAVGATLTLTLNRTSVSESAGASALTASVARNGSTASPLLVNLASATGTNVSLPANVTIPAGQHSAVFPVGVTDQFIAGGSFVETLSATAAGFPTATAPVTILYDDVAVLTLTLNTNAVTEDAAPGVAMGTVTRNANFGQLLMVTLTSDLPAALTVPITVKIPAGQASADFDLTPVNDNVVGDTRRVHLLASAPGINPVSATIDVLNVNAVNLSLDLADSAVAKGAASPATIGTVSRQPVSAAAQKVLLTVTGNSLVTLPGIVTIPAGAESVNFNVNVGDDQLATGPLKATLTAQVLTPAGLVDPTGQASTLLLILDTHGPFLKVAFGNTSIAKGSNTTVTVTRNTPPTNSLTVNLTANPSAAITYPSSVVIPQNQTAVTVGVAGVLDHIQTGPRSVTLTASAAGYNAGVGNLTVSDIYYADLLPTSLTFPTNAVTGQQITLNWVVANRGLADANGAWFDYIYLASDSLGQQPTLVNFKANAAPLPIGASYTNQASFTVPQTPGNYWIVLTTDGGNVVSEITKQNNSAITPIPVVVDAAYRAVLTGVSPAVTASGTPITFTGNTFNPTAHSPMPFSAATVRVLVNGTRRVFGVTSDANGNFSYTFQPLANEAGAYTAGADFPLVLTDLNQVSFALLGMQALPGGLAVQLLPNTPLTGQLVLSNLTDQTLTGLAISVPDQQGNLDTQFTFTNTTLPGGGTVTVGYQFQSSLTRSAQTKFSMTATSAEGAKLTIPAVVSVVPLMAQLEANPAYLTRGMLVGAQTSVSFDIVNTGGAASGDLTLQLPGTLPWLTLSSPTIIPSILPGGKATVILTLNPPANLPLTLYQGNLAVANNNTGISVPFQFRAVSSGKGDLRVTATDEYTYYVAGAPKVTNATVTVRDAITMAVIAQTNSDANGIAYFAGLAEGSYTVDASATSHNPSRGSAAVITGTTNDLEAFMSRQLVSYQWTVVPTEIADEYQIQLQSVFETEVPVPNVVIDEPKVMLFVFPGEASQFNFTLRNVGLIAAQGVTITPPNDPNYLITPLVTDVGTIPAMSAVTIPVTVQLRAAPAVPLAAGNGVFPKDGAGDCPVSISPCLPTINLNAQYYVPCGGHNVVQGRSAQLALLCEAKDTADKIKACLKDMKELVGSENLASVGCNAISAFLNCVGADLGPCQTLAISTACGALTGGAAGAAAAGLPGLPACICAHLADIPLPSFPHSDASSFGGGGDWSLPILPTGSYYVSGNPVLTSIYIGSCSDTSPNLRNGNLVSRAISPLSPLNIKAPVRPNASGGICAHVRLEIDQDVVLTRTAFTGTLQIDNGGSTAITDIQVNLTFLDATNGNVSGKFVTEGPVLNTLSAVDGSGTLAGGATGSAVYTFIPTLDAAPYAPDTFQIGGTLSYLDNGEPVVVPLLSAPITVYPEARLDLAYFQQRDVYGDDPFTPQVEPSEPFALGLLVKNVGAGNAHNFRITSGQPKIIDNEKGLLINFNIIGTKVGDLPVSPSLTANLGDITPGGVKEVTWDMLSTLQGKFISYNATFQHVNDLGVTNTSLINSVEIHELIHRVLANRDGDDDLPDFLVNDLPDPDNLPDTLYLSDGTEAAVNVFTNATIDGAAAAGHMQVQLSAAVSNGWNYIQVPDPGAGFVLDRVLRSDGKILAPTNNAWTTDRSFPASSTAAVTENLLHLFDWAGSGAYTLYYRSTNTTPPVIVQLGPVAPFVQSGAVSAVNIIFSEPVDLSTFDSGALTLTRNGGANLINSGSGITIAKVTDTTYAISGLQTLTATAGNYQLTVNGAGIYDLWGNSAGNVSTSVQWTSGNAPVVVQSLDVISPNPRNTPENSVNVTFSKPINPATLDYHALSLTLNGGPNLITSGVTVALVSGNTYAVNGLGSLTGADGKYVLTVNATSVQDAGGTTGFGTQSTAWTMVTTGPRIVALEQLATNPRNIVVQSLNVTFAQPIDQSTFDYHAVNLTLNGGPNLITSAVTVTPLNATTYKIANFNWVVGLPGTYVFSVNASGLFDLAGNFGSGSTNETWQMILETPASPANLVITPDTGIFANDGLTDTNAVVLSGTLGTTNLAVRVSDQTSGTDLGSATVTGTNFTKALTFTAQGKHQLKLTAVDVAGNVSAASYFNLFLDTTPPTAIIQAVTPNPVSWPVTNLLVTFSKAINTNMVSAANFTLTRDGANLGAPRILILSSNAVLVTGLTAPTTPIGNYQLTLNLSGIQDLAGNSSVRTVSTTWQNVPVNQPPVIVQEPNTTAQPGQAVQRQIQATDPEGNHFAFSLVSGAPAGAAITTNGLFRWTPACDQGGTTNLIIISAMDNGVPPASSSMAFTIAVGDCLQIGIGSTVVQVGTTGSVPVTVYSSAGVTNLSFTLAYPTNRFANWTIAASNNVVGTATARTLSSSQAVFNVTANTGGSLQGSALLGSIFFYVLPAPSAFVPLTVTNDAGTKSDQSAVGSIVSSAGRVVVIGPQSLLEAKLGTGSQRQVILYGNPGASYQLAFNTNLASTNWLPMWRVPMTNLYQTYGVGNVTPQAYYRAWEFSANPPILELGLPVPTNATLLLYGQNGTNYVVESASNLGSGVTWLPFTNLVLSNSFQFIPVNNLTNRAMFFRAKH